MLLQWLFSLFALQLLPYHSMILVLLECWEASQWWMLSLHPVRDGWLGAKLLLIVVYIVIGSLALKRAPTRPKKALAFAAALACAAGVVTLAITHGAVDLQRIFSHTG